MRLIQKLIIAWALPLSSICAQSSVWEVSNGEHTLYLGGTCHILRTSDYPLPAEFEQAYNKADSLAFEVDPAVLQAPEFAMRMMTESVYQDKRTLKSVLSEEAYSALAEKCSELNLPIDMLHKTKPGIAVMIVTLQELVKAGVSQEGVDAHYANRAHAEGKPVASLETADFQLKLLTELGEGTESEMVLYSLKDLHLLSELFDDIILAWRKGDMDRIEQIFVDNMADFPEIYNLMLKDRNLRWIPQIEAMLTTEPTEFVLVGVGHMPGKHGLIALLEAKGYAVTQVVATELSQSALGPEFHQPQRSAQKYSLAGK